MLAALCLVGAQPCSVRAEGGAYASVEAAIEHGFGAYKSGYYDMAIPPLEFAAARNEFLAEFYLATIFARAETQYSDRARAYLLFKKIADRHHDIDPDDRRAPFVARALTVVAGYVAGGLPEMRLAPNRERAIDLYQVAATLFDDADAQFELARLYLQPERPYKDDVLRAKDWLMKLAQDGHSGAQAQLAQLFWAGRYVERDPTRALGLIDMAVETASPRDRDWIDEIHQNIYCATPEPARQKAVGVRAIWKRFIGGKPNDGSERRMGLGSIEVRPERVCRDGRAIQPLPDVPASEPASPGSRGGGIREVGAKLPAQDR